MALPGVTRVPDPGVSLRFFTLSALGFGFLGLVLPAAALRLPAFLRNPPVLVALHAFTLGAMSSLVMGAMYMLLPVVLQGPPPDRRAGAWQFWIYAAGVPVLLRGFWVWDWHWIAAGGTLVAASAYLFAFVMAGSLRQIPRRDGTSLYVTASVTSLALVATWGVLLALNLGREFFGSGFGSQLTDHLTLGAGGWFGLAIAGFGHRLIQMFYLAYRPPRPRLALVPPAFVASLAVLAALLVAGAGSDVVRAATVAVLVLGLLYAADVVDLLRSRRRRVRDVTLLHIVFGVAWLVTGLAGALAGALLGPAGRPGALGWVLLVLALLGGWAGNFAMGFMHKIVSFLVWYTRFSGEVGRGPVPTLAALIPPHLPQLVVWLWNGGLLGTVLVLAPDRGTGLVPARAVWPVSAMALAALLFAASVLITLCRRPVSTRKTGQPAAGVL